MKRIVLFAVLALTSCSIGKRPDVEIYGLKANLDTTATPQNSCVGKLTLQVNDPDAAAGIETRRIAVTDGAKLDYYENVRWAATAPEMFGSVLVDSFERAKIFANINTEENSLSSDLALITDMRDFEVDDKSTGEVKLRLVEKLIDAKTRQIITTIEIDKKLSPAANNMGSIVSAFNQISVDAAAEIISGIKAAKIPCGSEKAAPVVLKQHHKKVIAD